MTGGIFHLYGNLWANAHGRQPLASPNTQYVNNVVYNYGYAYCAGDTSGSSGTTSSTTTSLRARRRGATGDDWYQMKQRANRLRERKSARQQTKDGTLTGPTQALRADDKATKANSTDTASMPTTSAADS